MLRLVRARVILMLLGATACVERGEVELQGHWGGSWSSGQASGSLSATFGGKRSFGDMTLYDVALVMTGPSCSSGGDRGGGDLTAARRADDVHLAVQLAGAAPETDENVFRFDGVVGATPYMSGTYVLTSDSCPACTCAIGDSGTWSLSQ